MSISNSLLGQEKIVRLLIDEGANLDIQDKHGATPLHLAIKSKQDLWETINSLIGNGADIHIKDDNGNTALHLAALNDIPGTKMFSSTC